MNDVLIYRGKFFIYRSKAFPISSRNDKAMRGDPRIIKEGFSKEVRIVGDNPEDAMAVLQIRRDLYYKDSFWKISNNEF